jgi:uncharacterized protein (DUF1697 family)
MTRRAALLRGVNLNGRTLRSADLKALAQGLGLTRVQTLLASGNVVFECDRPEAAIATALEGALADAGLRTDVLVRDGAELAAVLAANPWPEAAADHPSHLTVTFLREPLPAGVLERLLALHQGPERLHAAGRHLLIDYGGREGMRESKLAGAMARARFPAAATARNWNTVGKLAALLAA